ncbi:alpha/beta hydrolase [bacterium]|nr:alpha/beta hydrolase [bacterium]
MSKPDIVLIHGMWCTRDLLARLDGLFSAAGFTVHRFNSPGRAELPVDDLGSLSLSAYVDRHQQAIEALNLSQPPIVIGHSLGGLIAQKLAARMPVSALVLLTPAAPADVFAVTPRGIASLGNFLFSWGFWRKPTALSRDACAKYAMTGMPAAAVGRACQFTVPDSGRVLFEAAFPMLDSAKTTRVPAHAITCPVYVLACENDWLTPPSVVHKIAARYPQATVQFDAQRSHWVIDDDRTDETVTRIVDWLGDALPEAA